MAPGIVWVCALLAALLPLDRLFGADFEDGSLDQLLLCGLPPAVIAWRRPSRTGWSPVCRCCWRRRRWR